MVPEVSLCARQCARPCGLVDSHGSYPRRAPRLMSDTLNAQTGRMLRVTMCKPWRVPGLDRVVREGYFERQMLMQPPCSQGSHGKLAGGYEVGKFETPPQLSAEAAGRVQAFCPRPGRHSELGLSCFFSLPSLGDGSGEGSVPPWHGRECCLPSSRREIAS